eukprot:XP_001710236.1 Hypothetical protein GL50803_26173 [Giardia lamblia ATCC 50803]
MECDDLSTLWFVIPRDKLLADDLKPDITEAELLRKLRFLSAPAPMLLSVFEEKAKPPGCELINRVPTNCLNLRVPPAASKGS